MSEPADTLPWSYLQKSVFEEVSSARTSHLVYTAWNLILTSWHYTSCETATAFECLGLSHRKFRQICDHLECSPNDQRNFSSYVVLESVSKSDANTELSYNLCDAHYIHQSVTRITERTRWFKQYSNAVYQAVDCRRSKVPKLQAVLLLPKTGI